MLAFLMVIFYILIAIEPIIPNVRFISNVIIDDHTRDAIITGYYSVILAIILSAFGVLTFVTGLKEPDLKISIMTPLGDYVDVSENLCLRYYNNENIDGPLGLQHQWFLNIHNNGNSIASNMKITINFEEIKAIKDTPEYRLLDHIHALGGHSTLERSLDFSLNPGDSFNLPDIPWCIFSSVYTENDEIDAFKYNNPIKMKVTVYEGSKKALTRKYLIDMEKDDEDYMMTYDYNVPHEALDYFYTKLSEDSIVEFSYENFIIKDDAYSYFHKNDFSHKEYKYIQNIYFY